MDEGQLGFELVFHRGTLGIASLAELAKAMCEAAAVGLNRLGVNAQYRPRNDIEVAVASRRPPHRYWRNSG